MFHHKMALLSFQECHVFLQQQFVCLILNLPWKVISPPPALHYFLYHSLQSGFIHPSTLLPLSSPHRVQITRCCFVPQRPCKKFIGPESHHLTRGTWLTDLVPFPISSSSCVKLTFPAFRLYLNCERRRLMVPWEILLSPLSICLT